MTVFECATREVMRRSFREQLLDGAAAEMCQEATGRQLACEGACLGAHWT